MYAISINSLYKGKGLVGATRQTTKLHLILAATLKKSGGPKVKLQNCTKFWVYAISFNHLYKGKGSIGATGQTTKLHLIFAATFKK